MPNAKTDLRPAFAAILFLLILTVGYRLAASHCDSLGNTAPLMAITFGGVLLLGARFWWVPPLLLIVSDIALGIWHGSGGLGIYTIFSIVFYLGVAAVAGKFSRDGISWPKLWWGTLLCSLLFYLAANTFSWMVFGGYEKSLAGWWQSQTTGVPGINPPAWMFLRNALIADSIWCAIAAAVVLLERKFTREEVPASIR